MSFSHQRVAKLPSGCEVINPPRRRPFRILKAEKDLAIGVVFRPVIPGVTRIDLRMRTPACGFFGVLLRGSLFRRVEIKDALAGIAVNQRTTANFVISLRPQHHRASYALLVPHFSKS